MRSLWNDLIKDLILIIGAIFLVVALILLFVWMLQDQSVSGTVVGKRVEPAHITLTVMPADKGTSMIPVAVPEMFYLHVKDVDGMIHSVKVDSRSWDAAKEGDYFDNRGK